MYITTSFQEVPYSCFCLRSVRGKAPSHFYRPVSLGKVFGHVGTPSKPTDKGDVIQADFQDQHLLMVLMSVGVFLRCSAGQVTVPFFLIFTGLLSIGKDPNAGKDWGQEEKGKTEDEMAGWHPWTEEPGGLTVLRVTKESDTTEIT